MWRPMRRWPSRTACRHYPPSACFILPFLFCRATLDMARPHSVAFLQNTCDPNFECQHILQSLCGVVSLHSLGAQKLAPNALKVLRPNVPGCLHDCTYCLGSYVSLSVKTSIVLFNQLCCFTRQAQIWLTTYIIIPRAFSSPVSPARSLFHTQGRKIIIDADQNAARGQAVTRPWCVVTESPNKRILAQFDKRTQTCVPAIVRHIISLLSKIPQNK